MCVYPCARTCVCVCVRVHVCVTTFSFSFFSVKFNYSFLIVAIQSFKLKCLQSVGVVWSNSSSSLSSRLIFILADSRVQALYSFTDCSNLLKVLQSALFVC